MKTSIVAIAALVLTACAMEGPIGPSGEPGADGAPGIDGAPGADGEDGTTFDPERIYTVVTPLVVSNAGEHTLGAFCAALDVAISGGCAIQNGDPQQGALTLISSLPSNDGSGWVCGADFDALVEVPDDTFSMMAIAVCYEVP